MSLTIFTDVTGAPLHVGDTVRVIGVPDLKGMSEECRTESLRVFNHLVGSYKRIREFDEHGFAWLMFKIRRGADAGLHSVGIEPWLLKVRRTRETKSKLSVA